VEVVVNIEDSDSGGSPVIEEPLAERDRQQQQQQQQQGFVQVQVPMVRDQEKVDSIPTEVQQPPTDIKTDGQPDSEDQVERLAYIFALLRPEDLCSALLFTKQHRETSLLETKPSIVLLYPSTWDTEADGPHSAAVSLMRKVQEQYSLVYRPVKIHDTWEVNTQLLGELQWTHWEYERALYLRSPGIAVDVQELDEALQSSSIRKSWAPLSATTGSNPDILLLTPKGLQSPRRDMRRIATSVETAGVDGGQNHRALRLKKPAYVVLGDELMPDSEGKSTWYKELWSQYDKGRKSVCHGGGLLDDM
jgi:hypothetical protein